MPTQNSLNVLTRTKKMNELTMRSACYVVQYVENRTCYAPSSCHLSYAISDGRYKGQQGGTTIAWSTEMRILVFLAGWALCRGKVLLDIAWTHKQRLSGLAANALLAAPTSIITMRYCENVQILHSCFISQQFEYDNLPVTNILREIHTSQICSLCMINVRH